MAASPRSSDTKQRKLPPVWFVVTLENARSTPQVMAVCLLTEVFNWAGAQAQAAFSECRPGQRIVCAYSTFEIVETKLCEAQRWLAKRGYPVDVVSIVIAS